MLPSRFLDTVGGLLRETGVDPVLVLRGSMPEWDIITLLHLSGFWTSCWQLYHLLYASFGDLKTEDIRWRLELEALVRHWQSETVSGIFQI